MGDVCWRDERLLIAEGTEAEIGAFNQNWVPFVNFKSHAVATIEDVEKVISSLTE